MLYTILVICVCTAIGGHITDTNSRYGSDTGTIFKCLGILMSFILVFMIAGFGAKYNFIKSTANAQMEVLNEQNEIVLAQIEPLIQQALNYESNTYKEFKLTPENIVAFGNMYPQLQANSFIQSQINIIVENQKEIKDLKLEIASLNAYRLWLFTKKE